MRPIIDAVQYKPTASKYKIFIIDECHMLSNAAWNALLKTLEEPPPYVKFIFATTEGDKMLATIVSRCQRFDLRRIQTHQIVSRLSYICGKEKIKASDDALLAIARGAEGGMRDALSSLDQLIAFKGGEVTEEDALSVFGLVSRGELEALAGAILTGNAATILQAVDRFDSAGKNMRRLSAELMAHFRNLIVFQTLGAKASGLEATPDQVKTLSEQALPICTHLQGHRPVGRHGGQAALRAERAHLHRNDASESLARGNRSHNRGASQGGSRVEGLRRWRRRD